MYVAHFVSVLVRDSCSIMAGVVRRSSRTRISPATYTPSRDNTIETINSKNKKPVSKPSVNAAPYKLNLERAAAQKIEACQRVNFNIEIKHDNLIIELSAASYEEFKSVLKGCLEMKNITYTPYNKPDANGLTVEESLSIKSKENRQLYRVNCYHTSSRVMINGSGLSVFISDILPEIIEILSKNKTFNDINRQLRQACDQYIKSLNKDENSKARHMDTTHYASRRGENSQAQNMNKMTHVAPKSNSLSICNSTETENATHVHTDNNVATPVSNDICPICHKHCTNRSVECSLCLYWLHYKCLNLKDSEIKCIEESNDKQFACHSCRHLQDFIDDESVDKNSPIASKPSNERAIHDRSTVIKHPDNAVLPSCPSNEGPIQDCQIGKTSDHTVTPPRPNDESETHQVDIQVASSPDGNSGAVPTHNKQAATAPGTHPLSLAPVVLTNEGIPPQRNNNIATKRKQGGSDDIPNLKTKIKSVETKLGKTESEHEQTKKQLATAKAYIVKLESKCNESEESNRILRRRLLLLEDCGEAIPTKKENSSNTNNPTKTHIGVSEGNETAKLQLMLQEQRIRQLELENIRNACRMDTIEHLFSHGNNNNGPRNRNKHQNRTLRPNPKQSLPMHASPPFPMYVHPAASNLPYINGGQNMNVHTYDQSGASHSYPIPETVSDQASGETTSEFTSHHEERTITTPYAEDPVPDIDDLPAHRKNVVQSQEQSKLPAIDPRQIEAKGQQSASPPAKTTDEIHLANKEQNQYFLYQRHLLSKPPWNPQIQHQILQQRQPSLNIMQQIPTVTPRAYVIQKISPSYHTMLRGSGQVNRTYWN